MSFSARDLPEPSAPDPALEAQVRRIASAFAYPPAPDLARREGKLVREGYRVRKQRRPVRASTRAAWALLVVILAAALLLASPARARVLEWLRVGAVRIFLVEPTATPTLVSTGTPQPTPAPTLTPLPPESLLDLSGRVSLEEAAAQTPFTLRLPTYPADLREPQHVYYQEMDDIPVVILVWSEPNDPAQVRMALYQIGEGNVFDKQFMNRIIETTVDGSWAVWTEGPYLLVNTAGEVEQRRLVTGRTLLWTREGVTYRLETGLPLTEAKKIAESLEPWQGEQPGR